MKITTSIKLILLGAVLVAAGLGVREFRRQTDPERVRATALRELNKSVNGVVELGGARLELTGAVNVEDLSVRAEAGEEAVLECRGLWAHFDKASLLRLQPTIRRVVVIAPRVRLVHSPDAGKWNFDSLLPEAAPGEQREPDQALLADGVVVQNGTFVVQHAGIFGDDEARTYEGLYIALRPDAGDLERWRFEADILGGPLNGTHASGYLQAGDQPLLHVEIAAPNLNAEQRLWHQIPYGRDVWRDFEPEGPVGVTGTLDLERDGKLQYSFTVDARGVSATPRFMPLRVESAGGTVTVSNAGVLLRSLTGVVPAQEFGPDAGAGLPVRVRVEGRREWHGGADYSVEAAGVPICQATMQAIPEVGDQLWERLRPAGRCRLTLALSKAGPGTKMTYGADVQLQDASIAPDELPMPLEGINGNLFVDSGGLTLQDVRAVARQGGAPGATGRLEVDGRIAFGSGGLGLDVRAFNVRADESLVKAIPGAGEELWQLARPEGVVDVRALLEQTGRDAAMTYDVLVQMHDGRALLEFWPVPLSDVSGAVRLSGPHLSLERLTASVALPTGENDSGKAAGYLDVTGSVDVAARQADLNLAARNLVLDERLMTSIPVIGKQIWERAGPEGTASLAGTLSWRQDAEDPIRCLLSLDLQDVALSNLPFPVPVAGISGRLLLSETQALSDNFTAIVCAGQVKGALVTRYGSGTEYPTYAATLDFRQINLKELLDRIKAKEQNLRGLLSGSMDLGGALLLGPGQRAAPYHTAPGVRPPAGDGEVQMARPRCHGG